LALNLENLLEPVVIREYGRWTWWSHVWSHRFILLLWVEVTQVQDVVSDWSVFIAGSLKSGFSLATRIRLVLCILTGFPVSSLIAMRRRLRVCQ
jgi:hypothetical protein